MITKYVIVFSLLCLTVVLFTAYGIYRPINPDSIEKITFQVISGESSFDIGSRLESEGVIRSSALFNLYAILSGKRTELQAGTYSLGASMSIADVVAKIHLGRVDRVRVTVIEGWRSGEIADRLGDDGESFLRLIERWESDKPLLFDKPEGAGLEGYLFPDTYYLPHGFEPEDLIRAMLTNLDRRLTAEMRRDIKERGKSIFEIMTMASLIEEEVRTLDDKKVVSGILWKRLEMDMPLQVDATIVFLTGRRSTFVTIEETRIESPYNTYLNRGLPPGPISNPGLRSIIAAIYPKPSDYLFYLSKPDGETVFSRNFDEHVAAKNRYLR